MKIAVVGSGGREHALVKKIKQSPLCTGLYAIPGNGGMAKDAVLVPIAANEIQKVVRFCLQNSVEYVVVAPDDPLALGMVDALQEAGIAAFGPSKAAARIEASKVFSKNLMRKYGIPTAEYHAFSAEKDALAYFETAAFPLVVKADGLALGKGVFICETAGQAAEAVNSIMRQKIFGDSGSQIVVEEFLTGPEVSVLAFCDGETLLPMVSSMDHKRIFDGDGGPNTGGMGTIAPNPFYTAEIADTCMQTIFMPTVKAMQAEGCPFKGCLYFGLMLTPAGPKVIEYNCRFGDPETQEVLRLLESDLVPILQACTAGTLAPGLVHFGTGAAACVVLASGGYPGPYQKGSPINAAAAAALPGIQLYYAGAALANGRLITAGGRVVGVSATAPTLREALQKAYAASAGVSFDNRFYRKAIGQKALLALQHK
ncbi:MAG: phosphoribosylamine--glycine ligase [Oscillospiraceae bacterium]